MSRREIVPTKAALPAARSGVARRRPPIDWTRYVPYLGLHAACLAVLWVGWSPLAVAVMAATFFGRVFALTAFYHRYFSHRAFRTSRLVQFLGGALGACAAQRGPIWWAAQHRRHHRHSDQAGDIHSPREHGFWYAHMGWFMTREMYATDWRLVKDWAKFPELRWLDRLSFAAPLCMILVLYLIGALSAWQWPQAGATGAQLVVWGFIISTIALYHTTYAVNSLAHTIGSRRFATRDDSRNNFLLALVTFGEGWHNNHHFYPAAARQGFYWWEIDVTYYLLKLLAGCGIVWDLKPVPPQILNRGRAA